MIVLRLPTYNIDHRWGDDYLGVIRLPVSPPHISNPYFRHPCVSVAAMRATCVVISRHSDIRTHDICVDTSISTAQIDNNNESADLK